jgi:steroid 5-alpha reductase family enzyme
MLLDSLLVNLLLIAGLMTLLWVVSLAVHDASIVDPFWGLAFVAIAWSSFVQRPEPGPDLVDVSPLLVALVTIWGVRLSVYLGRRNLGKGEDYRYVAMRERYGARFPIVSLGIVFLLQAFLAWVVSLPVQVAQAEPGAAAGSFAAPLIVAGVVLWAVGLAFETIGDLQLARFKADPANRDQVMDRGLWRYTRHPNYFGDFLVWWGLFLVAASTGAWWTIVGPLLMTVLLLRVSGVAMLEKTIAERRPGYADYARRTSAFLPRPPKKV